MAQEKLDDNSIMPFGVHKGVKMIDVPDDYLIYLYKKGLQPGNVKDYIDSHFSIKMLRNNNG